MPASEQAERLRAAAYIDQLKTTSSTTSTTFDLLITENDQQTFETVVESILS